MCPKIRWCREACIRGSCKLHAVLCYLTRSYGYVAPYWSCCKSVMQFFSLQHLPSRNWYQVIWVLLYILFSWWKLSSEDGTLWSETNTQVGLGVSLNEAKTVRGLIVPRRKSQKKKAELVLKGRANSWFYVIYAKFQSYQLHGAAEINTHWFKLFFSICCFPGLVKRKLEPQFSVVS